MSTVLGKSLLNTTAIIIILHTYSHYHLSPSNEWMNEMLHEFRSHSILIHIHRLLHCTACCTSAAIAPMNENCPVMPTIILFLLSYYTPGWCWSMMCDGVYLSRWWVSVCLLKRGREQRHDKSLSQLCSMAVSLLLLLLHRFHHATPQHLMMTIRHWGCWCYASSSPHSLYMARW